MLRSLCIFSLWLNIRALRIQQIISREPVPVFVLWSTHPEHMKSMVFDWARLPQHMFPIAFNARNSRASVQGAFDIVHESKPPVAVWLVDRVESLAIMTSLEQGFRSTSNFTRHGVFHWNQEFCNQVGQTWQVLKQTYEPVSFVFQFAYPDENLAAVNSEKFMPWPLGPAWWKGWESNLTVPPIEQRQFLASFRGSINTHPSLTRFKADANKMEGFVVEDSGHWVKNTSERDHNRYLELMLNSKYALNFGGNNPNCYRVVEAVESGAVPILFHEPHQECHRNWAAMYGFPNPNATKYSWIPQAPFAVFNNWDEMKSRVDTLRATATDLSSRLAPWYEKWRKAFAHQFLKKLDETRRADEKRG
jgi:hypothetical protein